MSRVLPADKADEHVDPLFEGIEVRVVRCALQIRANSKPVPV